MPDNLSQITDNLSGSFSLMIRADASGQIGTGHIMRCIALGQVWKDGGRAEGGNLKPERERAEGGNLKPERERAEGGNLKPEYSSFIPQVSSLKFHPSSLSSVVFICTEIPDALAERVQSEGFDLIRIDAEPGSPEDLRKTLEVISDFKFQVSGFSIPPLSLASPWLVLDGYHFNLDYQRGIRADGIKLLLIDDYNHLPRYETDILLNQNINAMELDYAVNSDARLLLGTQYALLRREFRAAGAMSSSCLPEVGKKVLVTLGGADPDNVTLKVIQALNRLDIPDLQVRVIVGPANPHLESLQAVLQHSTSNIQLINSADMAELMAWADLAISAAGSTCWEFCCMGVPFVTVILAENQKGLAAELVRQGVAGCLGDNPSEGDIARAVSDLAATVDRRTACSARGREWVDGFGVYRVLHRPAQDMGLDVFNGHLSLRPADGVDMELFWQWANDPAVRANCYNPESIPLEAHREWFFSKLASDQVLMLVLELERVPVGQIRYERAGEVATVGFSIDRQFRGLGLGRRIVEQSLGWAFDELGVVGVRAEVFQSNPASQSVFQKAGFELAGTCDIKGVPSLVFVFHPLPFGVQKQN